MLDRKLITSNTQELNATADNVWARLRKLDGLEEIIPDFVGKSWVVGGVEPCAGAQRSCALHGQGEGADPVIEEVVEFNDSERFYSYTIKQGVPAKDMLNYFKVEELEGGKSKVTWSASMGKFMNNPNMTQSEFEAFVTMNGEALMAGLAKIYNN